MIWESISQDGQISIILQLEAEKRLQLFPVNTVYETEMESLLI